MAKAESCHNCVYAHWDLGLWVRTLRSGFPARPTCANHPESFGRMKECPLGQVCRNFRPRPPTPAGETVKTIPLGGGFYAYVDAADYEWLSRWTWHLKDGYAIRLEKRKHVYMHRQIMQPPDGMMVDHKNLNKLDNTRMNLRVCTAQENACNRSKKRGTSSRFHGVSYVKRDRKYLAQVHYKGETFCCGRFTDEIEAARARDHRAVEVLGEAARLNFPEEWTPRRRKRVHARFQATLKKDGEKGAKSAKGVKGGKDVKGEKAKRKKPKPARRPRPRATGHAPRLRKPRGQRARARKARDLNARRTTHGEGPGPMAERDEKTRKKRRMGNPPAHADCENREPTTAFQAQMNADARGRSGDIDENCQARRAGGCPHY